MDNVMDPELASEVVTLLARELKAVRSQQVPQAERRTIPPYTGDPSDGMTHEKAQALVAENDYLRTVNAALQERIAMLQDELAKASIKSEDIPLEYPEPTSHTRGESARLLAENEDPVRDKEALRTREKLSILQEKYKRTKAKVHEYDEILNELRIALTNCTQELEQSRKAVISEIDFRDFLNEITYEPVEGQLGLSSSPSYPRAIHAKLHKGVMDVCKGPYFLDYREVIWSPSGIALGLVVAPTFQYNPKIRGGTWTELEDSFGVGKQMDVCHLSGNALRYLGTYERVGSQGTMTIALQTLGYIDRKKLEYISKRTTLFPDLMPPSQTQMITNMYKQGVIKLRCFRIRCIAYNQTFAEKLRKTSTPCLQWDLPDNAIIHSPSTVARGNIGKRKRDPKSMVHTTKNKRRYGTLAAP